MANITSLFARLKNANFMRKTAKIIRNIERFEKQYAAFGKPDLLAKTEEFRRRIAGGERLEKILPEAFALARTAARLILGESFSVCGREEKWDMVHYRVQLQAGIALARNSVCEIATGEGKTLIATLPAFVYALFGRGCHIATVNEYLARRDCEWMRPLYSALGLSCDFVYAGQSAEDKKRAYLADITYGTAAEFGFDYLRDNSTTQSAGEKVQRGFFYCLVDEADSVLVDEARTPLIISGGDDEASENPFEKILPKIRALVAEQNKLCGAIAGEVLAKITKAGAFDESDLGKIAQVKYGAPRNKMLKRILKTGLANVALEKLQTALDTNLGEFKKREISEGLFYCVDEKNNTASLTKKGQDFLEPDNPDAFTFPDAEARLRAIDADASLSPAEKAARKSETAEAVSKTAERLQLVSQLLRAFSLYERDVDYIVRNGKIEIVDPNTGRVMEGRRWSDGLHQAVEAKEGLKIGAENITYATVSIQNYFRMYAYLSGMTGTASELSEEFAETYKMSALEIPPNKPCVRIDNPDIVFLTRAEKFARIVETVKSVRAQGRPVLVGTSSVEESETLSRMLKIAGVPHNLLNAKHDAREAELVARAGGRGMITIATNMAGRGTDIKLGDGVNELGGLFVIASEHNYSRRIDRQLMGRCARQGDNGQTQFIVSLEDEIFRKYADVSPFQNALQKRHRKGVPFYHPLFARLVEKTQDKLEGDYSAARKNMLRFDNPANKQRAATYAARDEILSDEQLGAFMSDALRRAVSDAIFEALPAEDMDISDADIAALEISLRSGFAFAADAFEFGVRRKADIAETLASRAEESLEKSLEIFGAENALKIKRCAALSALDSAWRDHLARLENLREAIYLRGYAQKDPYCEFEREAFDSFTEFWGGFRKSLFGRIKRFADNAAAAIPDSTSRERRKSLVR